MRVPTSVCAVEPVDELLPHRTHPVPVAGQVQQLPQFEHSVQRRMQLQLKGALRRRERRVLLCRDDECDNVVAEQATAPLQELDRGGGDRLGQQETDGRRVWYKALALSVGDARGAAHLQAGPGRVALDDELATPHELRLADEGHAAFVTKDECGYDLRL